MREGTEKNTVATGQTPSPSGELNKTEDKIEAEEFQVVPSMGRSFLIHAVLPLLILWIISVYGNTVVKKDNKKPAVKSEPNKLSSYTSATIPDEERETAINDIKKHFETNKPPKKEKQKKTATDSNRRGSEGKDDNDQTFDNIRAAGRRLIKQKKKALKSNPNDIMAVIDMAETLQRIDEQTFGAVHLEESIKLFNRARFLLHSEKKKIAIMDEDDTEKVELLVRNQQQLFATEYGLARTCFQGSMFEKAVEASNRALALNINYDFVLNFRASAFVILGKYEEAAQDYWSIIENEESKLLAPEAITGITKILSAKESVVEGGWNRLLRAVQTLLPESTIMYQDIVKQSAEPEVIKQFCVPLRRLHYALFNYYDLKTKNVDAAYKHLTLAAEYSVKSSDMKRGRRTLIAEKQQISNIKSIFNKSFFSVNYKLGHPSKLPIFIVGFYRSGSTLTERVLDAHPEIIGLGEDSVLNNNLENIRNEIVHVSNSGGNLAAVIESLGEDVIDQIKKRWDIIKKGKTESLQDDKSHNPKRFVDKMLGNYRNIGFINLLFPNALILHVIREPMDTVFSSFKHDFSSTALDHTNDFQTLAQAYRGYRELIEHWDNVLPGRITHIRYEDIVNDMPGVAKAIIRATELPWSESVLDFHNKKQAVNTLSTTQVRKGVYKHAIKSWKKYEKHLEPLVNLIGDRVTSDIKTTLKGYSVPKMNEEL